MIFENLHIILLKKNKFTVENLKISIEAESKYHPKVKVKLLCYIFFQSVFLSLNMFLYAKLRFCFIQFGALDFFHFTSSCFCNIKIKYIIFLF